MEKLKAEEAAYIAGIIDGEGAITLTSHKKVIYHLQLYLLHHQI